MIAIPCKIFAEDVAERTGKGGGTCTRCRFPRVLVSRRFAKLRSVYYGTSAAQFRHPINRLGERPCLRRLDRHARMAFPWSCPAQRVTFLSFCARRSDTPTRIVDTGNKSPKGAWTAKDCAAGPTEAPIDPESTQRIPRQIGRR